MRFSLKCWKYFGFALPHHMIGFKKSAPLLHPIRSKTETRILWLVLTYFNINYMYLFQVLIGSLDCLCPLWLLCDYFWFGFLRLNWKPIDSNVSFTAVIFPEPHSGFAVSTNKHSQFMACSNCYAVIQFHLKANTDSTCLKCIPYITTTKFVSTSKMPSQLIMYKNFSWYYNKKQQKYNKV